MSIVDLSSRLTLDSDKYTKFANSSDSLIYVKGPVRLEDGPASLELTIGDGWFDNKDNRLYTIPDNGLELRPHEAYVIETEQSIGVPLNAIGLVTGKGRYIFKGIFISSGKIDPGFCSALRIGLYNGGSERVILKRGDPFCFCFFLDMDTSVDSFRRKAEVSPGKRNPKQPFKQRSVTFLRNNWAVLISTIIAATSLIISIMK